MPSPKNKAKATGDTHLPEIESEDLPPNDAHPEGAGTPDTQDRRHEPDGQGNPPRGEHHAGVVKRDDEPA